MGGKKEKSEGQRIVIRGKDARTILKSFFSGGEKAGNFWPGVCSEGDVVGRGLLNLNILWVSKRGDGKNGNAIPRCLAESRGIAWRWQREKRVRLADKEKEPQSEAENFIFGEKRAKKLLWPNRRKEGE